MKLKDLDKVNELVKIILYLKFENDKIGECLETREYSDFVGVLTSIIGHIDVKYLVDMLEQIKSDNDARIEAINQELKELGVEGK